MPDSLHSRTGSWRQAGACVALAAAVFAVRAESTSEPARVARWSGDLDALVAGLFRQHKNAFHTTPRARFEAEAAKLRAEIPMLSDDALTFRLMQWVALTGDAHTSLTTGSQRVFRTYPIETLRLDDGLFIVATGNEQRDVLGARVDWIHDQPVDTAVSKLLTLTAGENAAWLQVMQRPLLRNPDALVCSNGARPC